MEIITALLGGAIVALMVIAFREFFARKRLQTRLNATQEQLAMITDHLQALVAYIDTQHHYIYVNQRYAEWYGFSKEAMIGKAVKDTVAPEAYQRARPLHEAALRGEHISFENAAPGPDGQKHHIWVDLVPHIDPIGKVKGFLGLILDISELKQKEAELRKAKEAAEAANQAKSLFLANMSHELRTPLNSILGFAQLISHSPQLSREDQEHLSIIQRSGEHLLMLINQVLDLSKIEAGRLTLDQKPFDLYQLLREVEEMFLLKAQARNLQFEFHHTDDVPPYIRADKMKLRQVLINLIGNAIKFTEEGGVTVEVRSEHVHASERVEILTTNLQFSISDTGPGIPQEEMETIFEAFMQTISGKQTFEGTGLGLAICRTFVRLMGGEIFVQSEPGRGSLFTVSIPVEILPSLEQELLSPTRQIIGLDSDQPCYHLLVVDDHEYNRELLLKLLRLPGIELREAQNGQEAIEIWQQWRPDLILMDLRMPVMGGYEATKKIRDEELRIKNEKGNRQPLPDSHFAIPHCKIIALSASSVEDESVIALENGCDDFLRKPFSERELFDILHTQLGMRYVYRTKNPPDISRHISLEKVTLTLAELPSELRNQLYNMTITSDIQGMLACIDRIRQTHAELAAFLTSLVNNFEYNKILEALEKSIQASEELIL